MISVAISDSPWPAKPFPIFFRSLAVDGLGDVFAGSLPRDSDASGVEELGFSLLRWSVLLASKHFRELTLLRVSMSALRVLQYSICCCAACCLLACLPLRAWAGWLARSFLVFLISVHYPFSLSR